jgi:hypothetical protein
MTPLGPELDKFSQSREESWTPPRRGLLKGKECGRTGNGRKGTGGVFASRDEVLCYSQHGPVYSQTIGLRIDTVLLANRKKGGLRLKICKTVLQMSLCCLSFSRSAERTGEKLRLGRRKPSVRERPSFSPGGS